MTAKFMSNTPYATTEFEMQLIPGFTPRRSGIVVSRLAYSTHDCNCGYCSNKDKKNKCTRLEKCVCLRERLVMGCVPIDQLLNVLTAEMREHSFSSRMLRLSGKPQPFFSEGRHKQRFESRWKNRMQMADEDAWCAALYLLTSNTFLWGKSDDAVKPDFINFNAIHVHGVDLDGYVLFHAAKDVYKGTKHISLSELTDPELVSDESFSLIITAFLIRRYGPVVILNKTEEKNA